MSNSIITNLFWVRKNWARPIPLEYENVDMKNDKEIKKISKISSKLKEKGKLTGNETIKDQAKIIEENIDMNDINNEDGEQMPVFCEDLKNYYQKDEKAENDMEVDNYPNEFDSISSDEENDFTIHPKDSLIVCGTAQDDFSNIEVYIYDEENSGLFVHHDIVLSSFPLSMEWLPFKNGQKANYAIVGYFSPEIEIWNLDILDVLEPELILGKNPTPIDDAHTNSVLSINLNPINPNVVATAGADKKLLLWDLNSAPNKAAKRFEEHTDKIQSVKWNKLEDNVLVTGSFDKTIKLFDVRTDKSSTTIKTNCDIECIDWSSINKFMFLASFENGRVDLFDIRKFDSVLSFQAHKKEATSVSFSPQQEALFMSTGRDSRVKIWDAQNVTTDSEGNPSPSIIMEKFIKKSTGELFCGKFADDCDYTIAVGGSKGELFIWELEESPIFCSRFGLKFEDNVEMPDELNNLKNKKRMVHKGKK